MYNLISGQNLRLSNRVAYKKMCISVYCTLPGYAWFSLNTAVYVNNNNLLRDRSKFAEFIGRALCRWSRPRYTKDFDLPLRTLLIETFTGINFQAREGTPLAKIRFCRIKFSTIFKWLREISGIYFDIRANSEHFCIFQSIFRKWHRFLGYELFTPAKVFDQ